MEIVSQESQSLELHVTLCAQRQAEIRRRLSRIEMIGIGILAVLVSGGYVTTTQIREVAQGASAIAGALASAPSP